MGEKAQLNAENVPLVILIAPEAKPHKIYRGPCAQQQSNQYEIGGIQPLINAPANPSPD
jgi:hypothetical protein